MMILTFDSFSMHQRSDPPTELIVGWDLVIGVGIQYPGAGVYI